MEGQTTSGELSLDQIQQTGELHSPQRVNLNATDPALNAAPPADQAKILMMTSLYSLRSMWRHSKVSVSALVDTYHHR